MSPLFMCEPDSPGSLSAEDCHSNNAGSEREGEGQQTGRRGLKRREKNRDAARKSRKKQTERADELHEELQSLERSNSALQKEISALRKDLHFYETTLKQHEPHCHFKTSPNGADSFSLPSFSDLKCSQTRSTSPGNPPQSPSSLSTSKTSSLSPKTLNCTEKAHPLLAVPVSTATPGTSSVGPSPNLFATCSNPVTVNYSVQPSTHSAPGSSFGDDLPITASPSGFLSSVSLLPNSVPSPVAQPQTGQHSTLENSSSYFNMESFLPKQDSFMTTSPSVLPPYAGLEVQNSSAVNLGYPVNVPQLLPFQSTGNPGSSGLLSSLNSSLLCAPHSFPVSPQSSLDPRPAPAFDLKLRHIHQAKPNPAPLLSQLTVPSPLDVPQTTSSSFSEPLTRPLQSHPGDPTKDLSLSEFLEINDWVLNGTNSL